MVIFVPMPEQSPNRNTISRRRRKKNIKGSSHSSSIKTMNKQSSQIKWGIPFHCYNSYRIGCFWTLFLLHDRSKIRSHQILWVHFKKKSFLRLDVICYLLYNWQQEIKWCQIRSKMKIVSIEMLAQFAFKRWKISRKMNYFDLCRTFLCEFSGRNSPLTQT